MAPYIILYYNIYGIVCVSYTKNILKNVELNIRLGTNLQNLKIIRQDHKISLEILLDIPVKYLWFKKYSTHSSQINNLNLRKPIKFAFVNHQITSYLCTYQK